MNCHVGAKNLTWSSTKVASILKQGANLSSSPGVTPMAIHLGIWLSFYIIFGETEPLGPQNFQGCILEHNNVEQIKAEAE